MDMYTWIISNKELFKVVYSLIIVLICVVIVFKTDKLFRLSLHQGIRYFRNAFLFYGVGFAIRYFFTSPLFYRTNIPNYSYAINIIFEFFLVMGGFFLFYSLFWKKMEISPGTKNSSLFNLGIFVFYIMTLIVVLLDYLWGVHSFMFFSQIAVFAFACILSYINYRKKIKKYAFPKFYFLAMLLGFFAWTLNAVAELYFNWNQMILVSVYALNLVFFFLLLYGVFRITKL